MLKKLIAVLLLLVWSFAVGGCTTVKPPANPVPPPNASSDAGNAGNPGTASGQGTMRITVYYASKDAMYLVPEVHMVPKNDRPAQTALEFLLGEPKTRDLVRTLPQGTKVRGIAIKDNIAYVDFNDKIIRNNAGGSATELLMVGAIVNTLTEFPEIHKVQILVEGKKVESLTGHVDVSQPLSRSEKIIKKL